MRVDRSRFEQDAQGQWWYTVAKSGRTRAETRECERCREQFLVTVYAKDQRYCGRECGNRSRGTGEVAGATAKLWRKSERYQQDDAGQWWYHPKNGYRTRCKRKVCEFCTDEFPISVYAYHKARFCSRGCATRAKKATVIHRRGADSHRWQRGKTMRHGYVMVYAPDHHSIPPSSSRRYVLEHRLVMEQHLDRPLRAEEKVHHINGVKTDNRIENLELWTTGHSMPGVRVGDMPKHCPTCTCGQH